MPRGKSDAVAADEAVFESESSEDTTSNVVLPTFAEVYAKLAAPFDKTYQRQIPGGQTLTYITGEQAMNRLTDVVGPYWDWLVTKQEIQGDAERGYHVVVSGTLILTFFAEGGNVYGTTVTREGIGGSAVKVKRDGQYLDIGNDFKAAETGALKRAAAKFGVGLYLYEKGEGGESELPQPYGQAGSYTPPAQRAQVQFPSSGGEGSTTGNIKVISKTGTGLILEGNENWWNASKQNPVNLGAYQRGQTVTITHKPGQQWIDGIALAGAPSPEGVEAF